MNEAPQLSEIETHVLGLMQMMPCKTMQVLVEVKHSLEVGQPVFGYRIIHVESMDDGTEVDNGT